MSLLQTQAPSHIHLPSINSLPFPLYISANPFEPHPFNRPTFPILSEVPELPKNELNRMANGAYGFPFQLSEEDNSYSSKSQSEDESSSSDGYLQQSIEVPSKKKAITKGSWSQHEDELLRHAVSNCSPILWDVVAEQVPGRTAIQCKERWLYRLHPEVKKTRFEKWEDDLIIRERNLHGNHWTLIANKLPGRTSCAVKNRWYSVLRNKAPQSP